MSEAEKIGIGADHAGFQYKEIIKEWLACEGYEVKDYGFYNEERHLDYKFIEGMAEGIKTGEVSRGICICGTGIAVSICANKIKGIRAALCNDIFTAKKASQHNNANVITFGARVIGVEVAKEILKAWLETKFEGGRHAQRNEYMKYLEDISCK
jgi:ribose 5-phosphate isomerase B